MGHITNYHTTEEVEFNTTTVVEGTSRDPLDVGRTFNTYGWKPSNMPYIIDAEGYAVDENGKRVVAKLTSRYTDSQPEFLSGGSRLMLKGGTREQVEAYMIPFGEVVVDINGPNLHLGNGRDLGGVRLAPLVSKPRIIFPVNGSSNVSNYPSILVDEFMGSGIRDKVYYQISKDPDFNEIYTESGWVGSSSHSEWPVTLESEGTYYVRAKDSNDDGAISEWSDVVQFSTSEEWLTYYRDERITGVGAIERITSRETTILLDPDSPCNSEELVVNTEYFTEVDSGGLLPETGGTNCDVDLSAWFGCGCTDTPIDVDDTTNETDWGATWNTEFETMRYTSN